MDARLIVIDVETLWLQSEEVNFYLLWVCFLSNNWWMHLHFGLSCQTFSNAQERKLLTPLSLPRGYDPALRILWDLMDFRELPPATVTLHTETFPILLLRHCTLGACQRIWCIPNCSRDAPRTICAPREKEKQHLGGLSHRTKWSDQLCQYVGQKRMNKEESGNKPHDELLFEVEQRERSAFVWGHCTRRPWWMVLRPAMAPPGGP